MKTKLIKLNEDLWIEISADDEVTIQDIAFVKGDIVDFILWVDIQFPKNKVLLYSLMQVIEQSFLDN